MVSGSVFHLKPGFTANSGCNFIASVGVVTNNSEKYYYLKDHLGSIRVTVDTLGQICGYDDYDAWGLQLDGRSDNFSNSDDKYKFTGKERDVETGYDYFGARYYDSRIGRWLQVDPFYGKYPSINPYTYTNDNPTKFIDPDGRFLIDGKFISFSSDWKLKFVGSLIGISSKDNLFDPNATKDFLKGFTVDKVVEGLLKWAGENSMAKTYSIGKSLYDLASGLSNVDKTEFLWKGEQEMIKDIDNILIFDGNGYQKLVVDPQELVKEYKKNNQEEVSNQLDQVFLINPKLALLPKDELENQLVHIRNKYAIKAVMKFWSKKRENKYSAQNQ